jgi:DNA-binding CsgD family transcriptional regulator
LDGLINRIYEAAAVPELWRGVLDDITVVGCGHFTAMFTVSRGEWRWIASENGVAISLDYISEGWPGRTDRLDRLVALQRAGFVGDLDVYTREEMEREPVFTEFHRPRGLGWGVATAIGAPSGDMLIFDVERRFESGPVEAQTIQRLDMLRPHLARAGLLSARLAVERSEATTRALELAGLPAAVLSRDLRILSANPMFLELMPEVVVEARQRIALADPRADLLFGRALEFITSQVGGVRSIPICAARERPPYIVHIVPVRRAATEVFTNSSAVLIVTPVVPAEVPKAEVLQGLFDLTPAEARVARGIAECQSVEGIADQLGVSRETIRTQLKAVLAKTGTGRQVELAALLAGSHVAPD